MDMVVKIPVNNQGIRVITETKDGWKCELFKRHGNDVVKDEKDRIFWDFNIPKQWLKRNHIADLNEFLSEESVLNVLGQYIDYVDELRHKCKCHKTNLYKNGELIWTEIDHPKNVMCRYVLGNKTLYPDAHAGERKGTYWLVGIEMNIKGIYFYDDLEARPVIDGKELTV